MAPRLVAVHLRDALQPPLERGVVERLDAPAAIAHEVVVVLAVREGGLEPGDAVTQIDAVHELELRELLEHAVDARDPDPRPGLPERVEELLRREAAVLPSQAGDDLVARRAAPGTGATQRLSDVSGPLVVHASNGSDSHSRAALSSRSVRKRIVPIFVLPLLLVGVVAACGGGEKAGSGTTIVAAFYPLEFLARELAPEADIVTVTPAGAEPHDLELTPRDLATLADADLVLYLGNGFQPALERAVRGKGNALDLLEGIELLERADEHGHGTEGDEREGEASFDPHVWLDPRRFAAMAERVAEALGDPGAASSLVTELEELDGEFRRGLARCERDVIVTSHAAFGYLADAYGLRQIALAGLSPEAEPSPRALERLVDEVEESGATTVFFETLVSPKVAETVARETGAETAVLNPLEGLTERELEAGADYVSVMRENLSALRRALACT